MKLADNLLEKSRQIDKRTRARALAVQSLYQLEVQGAGLLEQLGSFLIENEQEESVREQAMEWVKGTWENLKECDEMIAASIIRWDMSRLCLVDKSILRLAVYQLRFCKDVPPKVAINEAIELAKTFSTAQSPGFVNGVLDAVMKKLKPEMQ